MLRGEARQGAARQARHGEAMRGGAWHGEARMGKARQARHGMLWLGAFR